MTDQRSPRAWTSARRRRGGDAVPGSSFGRHLVRGDVHGRRKRVVARLAHVHVGVGLDRLLRGERPADRLDAPVGDNLIDFQLDWVPEPVCHTNGGN